MSTRGKCERRVKPGARLLAKFTDSLRGKLASDGLDARRTSFALYVIAHSGERKGLLFKERSQFAQKRGLNLVHIDGEFLNGKREMFTNCS